MYMAYANLDMRSKRATFTLRYKLAITAAYKVTYIRAVDAPRKVSNLAKFIRFQI